MYKNYKIKILGVELLVNLIFFNFSGFDVILKIDWLEKYRSIIDCESKVVTLRSPKMK